MEATGKASPGCLLRFLPDGRDYEIDMNDADEHSDAVCEEAARLAYQRGGGTHPVSGYDLERARVKVTGEVREIDNLRTTLATARAEAEALREALTAHNLRAANGDEITVADELEQAASTLEAFVVADKEHPLLDCADDDGVEYQSEYMASLMDHATINARTLRKWAHSLRAALSKGPTQ